MRGASNDVIGYRLNMKPLEMLLVSAIVSEAWAADPNAYDPLLDPPREGEPSPSRLVLPKGGVPGMRVGTGAGVYLGHVEAFLTADISRLEQGVHPEVRFGLGRRLANPVEFGIDFAIGLGESHAPFDDGTQDAIDLLVEPRVFAHYYETPTWSAYGGLGGLLGVFDLSIGGVSQMGFGPLALLGMEFRSERYSALYLELSSTFFYDFYAYEPMVSATETGALVEGQDRGAWYQIFRFCIGYRLSGF